MMIVVFSNSSSHADRGNRIERQMEEMDLATDGGSGFGLFKRGDVLSKHVNPSETITS